MIRFLIDLLNNFSIYLQKTIKYLSDNSPLIALIGIIIAVCTLREMAKQRRESYKPRLMFQNKNFFLQRNENGTPCFLKENPETIKDLYSPQFSIELKNIGLGSAHDIVVKWSYDHTKIIHILREYAKKTGLLRENSNNHFEFLFSENRQKGFGFFIKKAENEKMVLAFLGANEAVSIKLPDTLHSFLTMVSYLEWVSRERPRRIEMDQEEIVIVFDFVDIGGKKHSQRIKMFIKAYASQNDNYTNYGYGSLSFATR